MKKQIMLLWIIVCLAEFSTAQKISVIKVTDDTINAKEVNPLIYGNFIELGLGRQIEGLWAQKFNNSSFEEVPPFKEPYYGWLQRSKEDNLSSEKWWHSGYEENPWYAYPDSSGIQLNYNRYWNFHHGLQAVVLQNRMKQGLVRLAQDGIYLDEGSPHRFTGYLSNNEIANKTASSVEVTVGIYPERDFQHPLYESVIAVPDGIYREFALHIPALNYRGRVTFALSVNPGKTVACDGFSLMPINYFKGWRPQVVEVLRQIGVPMIRFPGGCFASFYDWREGVGPHLDRQPVVSEYWGGIEENQAGTAEFIDLCGMIGAEPFLCVNMLTGTADHAARWVEYCNSGTNTPMGALRQAHGHAEPFNVKYWELDNETYRRYGPVEYAQKCVEYSKTMKAADSHIKLVLIIYWRFNEHLQEMLEIAGPHIDIVTNRATDEEALKRDLKIIDRYNRENGTSITLSNTEWIAPLTWASTALDALNYQKPPDKMTLQEHEVSWHYAMNTARQLLLFQRLGGDFEFANFNNLANTWGQNIIECPKDTVFISAAGKIFQLMSHNPLSWILKAETDSAEPNLIFQAGINKEGDHMVIYVLNFNNKEKHFRLDPGNYRFAGDPVRMKSVFAESPLSSNTIRQPDNIQSSERLINPSAQGIMTFTVGPWSVNAVIIKLDFD